MKLFIKANFDLCTGCGLCQLACSHRMLGGYNPRRAVIRVTHSTENLYHFPVVCNQCENAYCANVCPTGAIQRNESSGALEIDREKCVACGLCERYCPIGMAKVDRELNKAVKCDLCGGKPSCVEACPSGALEIGFAKEKAGEKSEACDA